MIDKFDPEYYGEEINYSFENLYEILNYIKESKDTEYPLEYLESMGFDIPSNALNLDNSAKQRFDNIMKTEFGSNYTASDLGESVVIDFNGSIYCTVEKLNLNSGTFEIDGEYNSHHWLPISELSENQFELMIRDLKSYEFENQLIESGTDKNVLGLVSEFGLLSEYYYDIMNGISFEKFIENRTEVLSFDTEEAANDNGYYDFHIVDNLLLFAFG